MPRLAPFLCSDSWAWGGVDSAASSSSTSSTVGRGKRRGVLDCRWWTSSSGTSSTIGRLCGVGVHGVAVGVTSCQQRLPLLDVGVGKLWRQQCQYRAGFGCTLGVWGMFFQYGGFIRNIDTVVVIKLKAANMVENEINVSYGRILQRIIPLNHDILTSFHTTSDILPPPYQELGPLEGLCITPSSSLYFTSNQQPHLTTGTTLSRIRNLNLTSFIFLSATHYCWPFGAMPLSDITLVTPSDLVADPKLLLHKCGIDDTRTVFDGKVGSVVGNGAFFVMSPNMSHTFHCLWGATERCAFVAMDDMLTMTISSGRNRIPLHCVTTPPFLENPRILLILLRSCGLGQLDSIRLGQLGGLVYSLKQKVDQYKKDARFSQSNKLPVMSLVTALDHAFARLASLPMSLHQVQFGFALLQRCFLELKAYLDYMYIFHPRMTGEEPAATSVTDTIGVYAFDDIVVQEFVHAGLPVWIVKSYSYVPSVALIVLSLLFHRKPGRFLKMLTLPILLFSPERLPLRQCIRIPFMGTTLCRVSQSLLVPTSEPAPLPPPSATPAAPSSGPAHGGGSGSSALYAPSHLERVVRPLKLFSRLEIQLPTRYRPSVSTRQVRRVFEPICPPSIPTWSKALAAVDRDRRQLKSTVRPSDSGYVFPDPGLIIGVSDPEKIPKYIHTWLKYRHALIFRMSSPPLCRTRLFTTMANAVKLWRRS
ncbi:hypothetical protein Hypma_010403 [Hypsizygus marmoreus]|uniref:Uncharacterized protein n=1 Tax=Hypsizygus marmoreus TaxID=39966 RepID=A0A369JMK2_HYPMA|nr:hypothetical protein Hypma_010403 [Hypsizygus marmoreus]